MFVDTAIHFKATGEQVIIVAGTGKERNSNGKSTGASCSTPMGVCVEEDNNIFVTDAKQVPLSLIITPIKGTIGVLKRRGLLCKAFSVHLKHQPTAKLSITGTIRHVELLHRYLEEANKWILDQLDKLCKPASQNGTISHQTISSESMILRLGLKDLHKFLDNLNPAYTLDLHMCLTVQVENLHAMSHFKLPHWLKVAHSWKSMKKCCLFDNRITR